ncbi:hypothetical protein [Geodermatophilus sp. URMC 63]
MAAVARRLRAGAAEDWFTAIGTSMRPAVRAVQRVRLRPPEAAEQLAGQVVLVRVGGRWWLHRVVDEADGRALVAADNGMVNGWTDRAEVAGVLLDRG